MARDLDVDTSAAGAGLLAAGQERMSAIAAGVPILPEGAYISAFSTVVRAALIADTAKLSGKVTAGLTATGPSMASYDTQQALNTATLST
ncbi:hypothetical protein [Mycolicibacterium brumae]|uniref:Uncharacterized protein n=2 Tax=Mycolicibacterium brumae TaxID=85968 RepID=A0A2G5P3U7_9MYCO|nr:hypothetical protein [Mycolicibacterium brumae]MCV7191372.1 hypothetical protein [Mycolicibacterium brumae]PIB73109.1 hypothetical protein CQY22_018235 [Mycolicibacterium brumae]RWA17034.1 hypothetical protein MBRU_18860 [Mycolicibacterium brumae DSM 44177]UWW08167.1 hypothetical protein L2Z93_001210 [Mycolicibacterium brumae]